MLLMEPELKDDHIAFINEGECFKFHYFWLRHHCPCCVHDKTKERLLSPTEIDLELKALACESEGNSISIEWPDKHHSTYSKAWLHTHAYAKGSSVSLQPRTDLKKIETPYKQIESHFESSILSRLNDDGAVLVRSSDVGVESIISALIKEHLHLIETHFGRIEDLRTDNTTNKNIDQLGYTNETINLHTDQPFIETPPRYQLLYCMRKATIGGANQIVDVKKVAYYLREINEEAFLILTNTPIKLLRLQENFKSETCYPLIQMEGDTFKQVRASYFTFAPINLPYNKIKSWYYAYQQLFNLMNNPRNQYQFTLEPNDFIIYDNHRMLHGRSGFSGPRWMKGVYFDHRKKKDDV